MQLYSYYRSSAAYRVRIALALKGLDYDYIAVNLLRAQQKSSDYMSRNPQGLVPALETDSGELIAQSVAIMEWLEETYPDPALLPSEPINRALVRSAVNSIVCDIHPLNNMSVTNYLQNPMKNLANHGGACCFGDVPTMADACLVPQVYNAFRFNVEMGAYPNIVRVWEHCNSLEAFAKAHPDAQADAPEPS